MKYFTLKEFDSPDEPGSGKHMDKEFLEMFQRFFRGLSVFEQGGLELAHHSGSSVNKGN